MKNFKALLMPAALLILSGVVIYDRFLDPTRNHSNPVGPVSGATLGRGYALVVTSTLGEAWNIAAQAVVDGKSVAEARKDLQDYWLAARTKTFTATVIPEFSKVLPEGTEPKSTEDRAAVAKLWRDFAKGLKGGR